MLYISMGSAVSIIIGQLLGAGKMEEAKDTDTKLISFSVGICVIAGLILLGISDLFPCIYNTSTEIKALAGNLIRIVALFVPINAFLNTCYFTIRAGGKTIITFLFDSAFMWLISIPVAFALTRLTTLPILPLFLYVQMLDLIKCVIGFVMVKKGMWISNIVVEE